MALIFCKIPCSKCICYKIWTQCVCYKIWTQFSFGWIISAIFLLWTLKYATQSNVYFSVNISNSTPCISKKVPFEMSFFQTINEAVTHMLISSMELWITNVTPIYVLCTFGEMCGIPMKSLLTNAYFSRNINWWLQNNSYISLVLKRLQWFPSGQFVDAFATAEDQYCIQ